MGVEEWLDGIQVRLTARRSDAQSSKNIFRAHLRYVYIYIFVA